MRCNGERGENECVVIVVGPPKTKERSFIEQVSGCPAGRPGWPGCCEPRLRNQDSRWPRYHHSPRWRSHFQSDSCSWGEDPWRDTGGSPHSVVQLVAASLRCHVREDIEEPGCASVPAVMAGHCGEARWAGPSSADHEQSWGDPFGDPPVQAALREIGCYVGSEGKSVVGNRPCGWQ